jgi:hypothetical protein
VSALHVRLRIVHLSSEPARQAVRHDCSFAKKQESPPAFLVVVPCEGLEEPGGTPASVRQRESL